MSALGDGSVAPDGSIDVQKLDPVAQKAFQYAVDFYEKDRHLSTEERAILADTYTTVSYATLGIGWATFFAVTSVPFFRQKYKTGSTKGTNVGVAMLFGIGALMVASPFAANKSYNWQLDKLRQQNQKCYEVAKFLRPGDSAKWTLYYRLTKDHPEHIMKDPRSKEAAEQRKKTIYTGRDPLGLHSGPRHEISKGPKPPQPIPPRDPQFDQPITGFDTITPIDQQDPFEEKKETTKTWTSTWDKIRDENGTGSASSGSSWDRLRNKQTTSSSQQRTTPPQSQDSSEQSDFDKLLEQERRLGEDENSKW